MKRTVFDSPLGESYLKVVHPSGLEIYLMEKPQFSTAVRYSIRNVSFMLLFELNGLMSQN